MNITNTDIKNLKDKKYRRDNGLFLVEGDKFCRDLLITDVEIIYTITNDHALTGFPNTCVVSDKMLASLATTKTNQSIICVCRTRVFPIHSIGNALILDNLQDPGNVGTLIRSARAFGFSDIYLVDCADVYSEKVIRSSAGLVMSSRVHICDYGTIHKNKEKIAENFIVADMFGTRLDKIHLPKSRLAVIIGNEGNGVGEEMRSIANITISIPMASGVESLNAGVAGSIIMQRLGEV
ncbi:MAG: RNA methyltransferase [Clostridiales bacterium]|nr:RNA methyltransferase [Clostridiales bacterium]